MRNKHRGVLILLGILNAGDTKSRDTSESRQEQYRRKKTSFSQNIISRFKKLRA